jgi:hypothetical protein
MDVPRVVRTQVTTGELDPPQDLVNSELFIPMPTCGPRAM